MDLPKEVEALIRRNLSFTPAIITGEVQKKYPNVSTAQIRNAWQKMSEEKWKRDEDQIKSACKLLEENKERVDLLEMTAIEGVEAIAWAMKGVMVGVKDVVEVALDATCE